MIDLKTIKNITIKEGSVTKITDSSGVVLWQKETGSSASLDIDLNNQWIESTKTLDGYNVYMSNSNKGVNSGYSSMKFKFKGMPDFKIWINSYAESCCDYTVAWNIDVDFPTSNPSNGSTGVKAHTQNQANNPTGITAFTEVDYPNDGGEHFVVVTYRKDYSVNSNDDRGYVAVKLTPLSTTWVVSATEFVKKDDKYYQRLNEVGTYEGGVTALTGNYKEGNELTVTYKQGTADDYMVVGSGKYYKKYAYVTPKDQEINTGDYVQGDYIGEATPSMKVTYTDNTEKTFYNLTSIESDTDPNKKNAKNVEIYDGVTEIGVSAFSGCTSLSSVNIPSGVTKIYDSAFKGCTSLSSVNIPSGVTKIYDSAFKGCTSLSSVNIPSGVTQIDGSTFMDCTSLSSVNIPSGVTFIGYGAFKGCTSLSSVNIPSGVTQIVGFAFNKCYKLSTVTIEQSVSKLEYTSYLFDSISSSAKLYVPSNLLSDYQADSKWTNAFGGGIFAIGEQVITNQMDVEYDNLGESTSIGGLTRIDRNTIDEDYKENVSGIKIYYGVTSIGDYSFKDCFNLSHVRGISYSVKTIGEGAFWGCSDLYDITLPYYVTSIGKWAFSGCSHLKYITVQASTPPSLGTDAIPSDTIQTIYVPASSVNAYKSATNWSAFASKIKAIGS